MPVEKEEKGDVLNFRNSVTESYCVFGMLIYSKVHREVLEVIDGIEISEEDIT